jgi:hypothetical protein
MVSPRAGRKRRRDEEDRDEKAAELPKEDGDRRDLASLRDAVRTEFREAAGGLGRAQAKCVRTVRRDAVFHAATIVSFALLSP